MFGDLWTSLGISYGLIVFLNCLDIYYVDWMWIPFIDVLTHELVIDTSNAPMLDEVFVEVYLDIIGAWHNHRWFQPSCRIYLVDRRLLHAISGTTDCTTLYRGFGPRVMKSSVSNWLPLLLFLIIGEKITWQAIKENMITLDQFREQIWRHSRFDIRNGASLFATVNNWDLLGLHGTIVGQLCHATARRQRELIGQLALIKELGQLLTLLQPRQVMPLHIDDHKI